MPKPNIGNNALTTRPFATVYFHRCLHRSGRIVFDATRLGKAAVAPSTKIWNEAWSSSASSQSRIPIADTRPKLCAGRYRYPRILGSGVDL